MLSEKGQTSKMHTDRKQNVGCQGLHAGRRERAGRCVAWKLYTNKAVIKKVTFYYLSNKQVTVVMLISFTYPLHRANSVLSSPLKITLSPAIRFVTGMAPVLRWKLCKYCPSQTVFTCSVLIRLPMQLPLFSLQKRKTQSSYLYYTHITAAFFTTRLFI